MNNKDKIQLANNLLLEVITNNRNNDLEDDLGFDKLNHKVKTTIVKHWYLYGMSEVFINADGEEIDEFLDTTEMPFNYNLTTQRGNPTNKWKN